MGTNARLRRPTGAVGSADRPAEVEPGFHSSPAVPRSLLMLQSAAGNRAVTAMVQRRLGFEFETGVTVQKPGGGENDASFKDPVKQGAGWAAHADNSKLEFVTTPFATHGERKAAMTNLTAYVEKLQDDLSEKGVAGEGRWHLKPPEGGTVAAKPQASFGVPIAMMEALLTEAEAAAIPDYRMKARSPAPVGWIGGQPIESTGVHLARPQRSNSIRSVDQMMQDFRNTAVGLHSAAELAQACGLASLVLRQLNDLYTNSAARDVADYSKSALGVLHRTDLRTVYETLSPNAKALVTAQRLADAWWEGPESPGDKLTAMGQFSTHGAGFTLLDGGTHYGYPLNAWLQSIVGNGLPEGDFWPNVRPIGHIHKADMANYLGVRRNARRTTVAGDAGYYDKRRTDLTEAALKRRDLLSRGAVGQSSSSIGQLGLDRTDPNFPHESLTVIEFRDLANAPPLPCHQWDWFADEMHQFYERATGVRMLR